MTLVQELVKWYLNSTASVVDENNSNLYRVKSNSKHILTNNTVWI